MPLQNGDEHPVEANILVRVGLRYDISNDLSRGFPKKSGEKEREAYLANREAEEQYQGVFRDAPTPVWT